MIIPSTTIKHTKLIIQSNAKNYQAKDGQDKSSAGKKKRKGGNKNILS